MTAKYHDPNAWVQPDQFAGEFGALLNLYREVNPKTVLEIGVREGGTFYQWMKHAERGTTLLGVDLPTGRWGENITADYAQLWQDANTLGLTVSVILGNSHHVMTKRAVKHAMPIVDFLFIDGDHTFKGVKDDFEYYSELVQTNGVIAFHDILPDASDNSISVHVFWNWVKHYYNFQEFTSYEGQNSRGIGVIIK